MHSSSNVSDFQYNFAQIKFRGKRKRFSVESALFQQKNDVFPCKTFSSLNVVILLKILNYSLVEKNASSKNKKKFYPIWNSKSNGMHYYLISNLFCKPKTRINFNLRFMFAHIRDRCPWIEQKYLIDLRWNQWFQIRSAFVHWAKWIYWQIYKMKQKESQRLTFVQ